MLRLTLTLLFAALALFQAIAIYASVRGLFAAGAGDDSDREALSGAALPGTMLAVVLFVGYTVASIACYRMGQRGRRDGESPKTVP